MEGYDIKVNDIGRIVSMTKEGETYYFLVDSEYNIQKLDGMLGIGTTTGNNDTQANSGYVQKGLILNLDAINNGENGSHDENETEIWYDSGVLMNNAKLYNCTIGENYIEFNGSSSYATLPTGALGNYQASTIQVLANPENKSVLLADNASFGRGLGIESNNEINTYIGSSQTIPYQHITELDLFFNTRLYTIIYDGKDYNNTNVYLDLTAITRDTVKEGFSNSSTYPLIGKRTYSGYTSWPFKGKIYAIRVYNRILSEEEIEQNYKLDKLRFGL